MFRCKQFSVDDSLCAMKVSTDALILGSWADPKHATQILDIGCGSGILLLMMLQKGSLGSRVDGIDIHFDAVEQSKINIANSLWSNRATAQHCDVLQMTNGNYDFIISNPPYFNESTNAANKAMTDSRRVARHQSDLNDVELLKSTFLLSSQDARLVLMYPFKIRSQVIQNAQRHGWYLRNALNVRSKPNLTPYITLFEFVKIDGRRATATNDLVIRNETDYSVEFKTLCRDFYLRF